jgi:SAM-dependent methyltransferase
MRADVSTVADIYTEKTSEYFENARREILPLLPAHMDRVLEVGCGTGATLRFLKEKGYCAWAGGVELFPEAAKAARVHLDDVYEGNIEKMELPIEENSLDAVLCLDVLEHLMNPGKVIKHLHELIKPGGFILASIPNVRHHTVSFPLFFRGQWTYKTAGILDNTHLKFFVRDTAIQLMESSGLAVDLVQPVMGPRSRVITKLLFGVVEGFLSLQYLIRAKKLW